MPPGRQAALFVLLYAGLRIPIDLLREYPINQLGLPTGQGFNILMTMAGGRLLARNVWRERSGFGATHAPITEPQAAPAWRVPVFVAILVASLVIASDATRDIPELYGHRHQGLQYSAAYPHLR